MIKVFVHDQLIVELFGDADIRWKENLMANASAKCINIIHCKIHSEKVVKIASILNSKPLPVETPEKYKVLCQYGISLDDLQIWSLMQDLMHWTTTYLTGLTSSLLLVGTTGKEDSVRGKPDDKIRGEENEEGEKQVDVNNAACDLWKQSDSDTQSCLSVQQTSSAFRCTQNECRQSELLPWCSMWQSTKCNYERSVASLLPSFSCRSTCQWCGDQTGMQRKCRISTEFRCPTFVALDSQPADCWVGYWQGQGTRSSGTSLLAWPWPAYFKKGSPLGIPCCQPNKGA